jgi:hypothetical protein
LPVFPGFEELQPPTAVDARQRPQHRSEKNEDATLNYVRHEPGTGHGSVRAVTVDGAGHFHHHPEPAGFNDDHNVPVDVAIDVINFDAGAKFDRHRHFHQPVHHDHPERKLDIYSADALDFLDLVADSDHAFVVVDLQPRARQHQSGADAEHFEFRQDRPAAEYADQHGAIFRLQRQCLGQHQ